MGKYLHHFVGDSAQTQHDELYNGDGYYEPWVAFTDGGLGVTWNKATYPTEFSCCEFPDADWSRVERFYFTEFPEEKIGNQLGFYINEDEHIDIDFGLYYVQEEIPEQPARGVSENYVGWLFSIHDNINGTFEETPLASVDELNEALTNANVMKGLNANGPIINELDENLCGIFMAVPENGYWPGENGFDVARYPNADWSQVERVYFKHIAKNMNYSVDKCEIAIKTENKGTIISRSAKNIPEIDNVLISGTLYYSDDEEYPFDDLNGLNEIFSGSKFQESFKSCGPSSDLPTGTVYAIPVDGYWPEPENSGTITPIEPPISKER